LLLESRSVDEEQHEEWLRSHGLHTEHLPLWEQGWSQSTGLLLAPAAWELREIVTDKEKKQREELAELKRKNKELERELRRKDKALAETAALLALKKRAEAIWGDDEDD
jgi:transposase